MSETYTTDSAEALAEVLWRFDGYDNEPGDEGALDNYLVRVRAIIASDWMKCHDAEVRAEALREAAEVLGDHRTLPEVDDEPVFSVMQWLRDRAALAEEGDPAATAQAAYDTAHDRSDYHCLTDPCQWHPGEQRIWPRAWRPAALAEEGDRG